MSQKSVKNIAASIRQKLLNNARETRRPFEEVLQYYAMERFLYRLSVSPSANKFVLKGALMLVIWQAPLTRPTRDIDMLGMTDNGIEHIVDVIKSICGQDVENDGLIFDPGSVIGERIDKDGDYYGVRARFSGKLDTARVAMQIDVGFGDVVVPEPSVTEYPTILDLPAPRLRAYSRETAIAEKFEAMVTLDVLNSRMKDFFDIWLLSRQFDFDSATLASAIIATFANRKTTLVDSPVALSEKFSTDPVKQTQWRAFIRKSRLDAAPESFEEVVGSISAFIKPVIVAIMRDEKFTRHWHASGAWV